MLGSQGSHMGREGPTTVINATGATAANAYDPNSKDNQILKNLYQNDKI